jgi:hypothetical protein
MRRQSVEAQATQFAVLVRVLVVALDVELVLVLVFLLDSVLALVLVVVTLGPDGLEILPATQAAGPLRRAALPPVRRPCLSGRRRCETALRGPSRGVPAEPADPNRMGPNWVGSDFSPPHSMHVTSGALLGCHRCWQRHAAWRWNLGGCGAERSLGAI